MEGAQIGTAQGTLEDAIKGPRPIAREKLAHIIAINEANNKACQRILDHINKYPEIEADMVKVFGITPPPA